MQRLENFKKSLFILIAVFAITALHATEITVFAAASLSDSLKEIGAIYERKSADKIIFNFGGSSLLARQIEEGAPADIFFSADEAKMNALEKKALILKETRQTLLGNKLVIIVAQDKGASINSSQDLASGKVKNLALAEPSSVPAGIYAKEYLQKQKLWSAIQPKVIPTENVRAAMAAVEAGNAEAAIVYKTDAAMSKKVKVAVEIAPSEMPNISYPVAVTKESPNAKAAKDFLRYLTSDDSLAVFKKFGFIARK